MYDPQQAGLAAVVARLDARDQKAAATPPAAISPETPQGAGAAADQARPTLKDAR